MIEYEHYLPDMDYVFIVVEPMPSRMSANLDRYGRFRALEESGETEFQWVVNRMNGGVPKRQIKSFLKSNNIIWFEQQNPEDSYGNEFLCMFPWEDNEKLDMLKRAFSHVLQLLH